MNHKPIRVLHTALKMDIDGGIESLLYHTYLAMDRAKIQFDFYTCSPDRGMLDDELTALGSTIYYNEPITVTNMNTYARTFAAFLNAHPEYKIVHSHMNQWSAVFLKGAKMAGVPIRIAQAHTALQGYSLENTIKNIIKLPVNRYATHRFAVSQKAGSWLFGEKAMRQGKVEIWPNAIDRRSFNFNTEIRAQMRRELGIEDCFTLIHVGTIRPVKNHSFLLDVFAALVEKEPHSSLILIGRDGMNGLNQKKAAALGIADQVQFLGLRADIPRLLQAGDVFVFPSLYEGLPGAVLEAQAAGLPCVISDRITDEVWISPLVMPLSLSLSAEQWADKVLACLGIPREDTEQYFRESDFDINNLVDKLTEFYLHVSGNEPAK